MRLRVKRIANLLCWSSKNNAHCTFKYTSHYFSRPPSILTILLTLTLERVTWVIM